MAQDRGSGVTGSDRYGDKSAADHETRIDLTAGRRAGAAGAKARRTICATGAAAQQRDRKRSGPRRSGAEKSGGARHEQLP
tara:strand:+ start:372 stop:614 length:243 start_codon:yes stop_codon:yes gene_type:complete